MMHQDATMHDMHDVQKAFQSKKVSATIMMIDVETRPKLTKSSL